jgi:hypothetical protein
LAYAIEDLEAVCLLLGRVSQEARDDRRQALEMGRHDSKMIARRSFELQLVCEVGPDCGWIGREVGWNCGSDEIYFAGIKPGLITFQRKVGSVAEMLQSG